MEPEQVLRFWFEETPPRTWFAKDPEFDRCVRDRFGDASRLAITGGWKNWESEADDALALVLLLDQFPRQIWRDTPMAFAGDERALALSRGAVANGWVAAEPERARHQFWLMPWMHSEDLAVQEDSLPLFERFTNPRTLEFARRHRDVIARFGRFPHRNAILGRASSEAEKTFLKTPGSGF